MRTLRATRERIEAGFGAWGHLVARRAWLTIVLCCLLTLGLAVALPGLTVDTSDRSFLRENDPVRITYDLFSRQFARSGQLLIALQPQSVFTFGFLETLRGLHEEIAALPQVRDVKSLINARNTFGRNDELVVEDLLERWPATEADLRALEVQVLASPLYRNYLISEDGRITTLSLQLDTYSSLGSTDEAEMDFLDTEEAEADFLTPAEGRAIVTRIREVLDRYEEPKLQIYLTGGAAYDQAFMSIMKRDISVYIGLSGVLIALTLLVLFKRVAGVALSMTVVVLALLCDAGTMALLGIPITLPLQILPSFLVAVGTCASVHILVLFYRTWEGDGSRERAIASALEHSGLPVVMAGLTTAGGLASFVTSDLAPVSHFGIFGPLGVIYSLLFSITLLPALLSVVPMRERSAAGMHDRSSVINRTLVALGFAATRNPWTVLGGAGILLMLAIWGGSGLRFSHDPVAWLPEDHEFRTDTEFITRVLKGSSTLDVLVESGEENGLYDPELMSAIDQLHRDAETVELGAIRVGKVISVADILKETHQALNENRPEFYEIPEDRALVAQELLLFENSGSDDLEELVDTRFSVASVTLRVPWADGVELASFIDLVEARFEETIGPRASLTMTGKTVIFARTFSAVIRSMAESYVLALIIITPLMILLIGSLERGLISMVPNLFPIAMTLGLMGWMNRPLDFSTMMMGAIVLGIAVDDTIHFLHVFERYFQRSGDIQASVRSTLQTTGRAITFTSIVLTMGFGAFMLSGMGNMKGLGFFVCFAIVVAFLADILITPALLVVTRGTKPRDRYLVAAKPIEESPAAAWRRLALPREQRIGFRAWKG